jgi:hypothetical protein
MSDRPGGQFFPAIRVRGRRTLKWKSCAMTSDCQREKEGIVIDLGRLRWFAAASFDDVTCDLRSGKTNVT